MPLDITDHPLYDTALEEAVKLTPPTVDQNSLFKLSDMQHIMARMWIQGMNWGVLHPQAAVSATMNFGLERKAEAEAAAKSPGNQIPDFKP